MAGDSRFVRVMRLSFARVSERARCFLGVQNKLRQVLFRERTRTERMLEAQRSF